VTATWRRLRVGVLELLRAEARPDGLLRAHRHLIARQYASITPQAVSVWCRQLGHAVFYATHYGQADPAELLPSDLDVVFIATYTSASPLAYALARLHHRRGTLTVVGGPHAKAFPEDCLRFFDVVVGECDRTVVAEILRDLPRGARVSSGRPLTDVPSVEERLPEIRAAAFWRGRPHPYAVIGILASVGCPYRCDFCTDWDADYRALPADRVEADLAFVSSTLPGVKVAFHDPNFAVRFDDVIGRLEQRPLTYMIESSLSVLRGDRIRRLGDTGCWYAAAGVESWVDYSNKTAAAVFGARKLARVLEHFALLSEHVPVVQANFIFGVDEDRGDEPVELTREFIRRAPSVWPNVTIPTPFGGTPLYDAHRREGRILETMPFGFYNAPYLVTTPKHYEPLDYYERLVRLLGELATGAALRARLDVRRGTLALIDALRLLGIRRTLGHLRTIADLLRTDGGFRAFHARRTAVLPAFYRRRLAGILGRYAELLTDADMVPELPAATSTSSAAAISR
jgi:radical SAM superfamily enzyme YgiQ (UPF0313 family)